MIIIRIARPATTPTEEMLQLRVTGFAQPHTEARAYSSNSILVSMLVWLRAVALSGLSAAGNLHGTTNGRAVNTYDPDRPGVLVQHGLDNCMGDSDSCRITSRGSAKFTLINWATGHIHFDDSARLRVKRGHEFSFIYACLHAFAWLRRRARGRPVTLLGSLIVPVFVVAQVLMWAQQYFGIDASLGSDHLARTGSNPWRA